MLELTIGGTDGFNDITKEYVKVGGTKVQFEHSLVSLSKWESKFEKPFLGAGEKSDIEIMEYIHATVTTPDFSPEVFSQLSEENVADFNTYINSKQTATRFFNTGPPKMSKVEVTSELIYYWMISYQIPFECQYWFLNRLLTLIQVCQVKAQEGQKGKKLSRSELATRMQSRAELNAMRRAQMNSTG